MTSKALRAHTPRSSFGAWRPSASRAPLALLAEQERHRIQDLLPIRRERMLASPFAFYRGSAIIMAADLATLPVTGLEVQACGDAHLANFGVYASPERNLVFDLNDFDETARGPWEWDVFRMATSVLLAAEDRGFPRDVADELVRASARAYRKAMRSFATMSPLEVWYEHTNLETAAQAEGEAAQEFLRRTLARGKSRTAEGLLPKLTSGVPPRFADEPPTFRRIGLESQEAVEARDVLRSYRRSLPVHLRVLYDRYEIADVALKVVGVGSVGTTCLIALHLSERGDPLLLQIKEAQMSVITQFAGGEVYKHQGERVVRGQRLMQAYSDIFLGWTRATAGDFYVRQLRDMKISLNLGRMSEEQLAQYAVYCARTLARAHARTGNSAAIGSYLGGGTSFDDATVRFARVYAGVANADYALFRDTEVASPSSNSAPS